MTIEPDNMDAGELAPGLAAASEPVSPSRELWKDALAQAGEGAKRRRRWVLPGVGVAAALAMVVGAAMMMPRVGVGRWDASPGMVSSISPSMPVVDSELKRRAVGVPAVGVAADKNSYAMMPPVGEGGVNWSGDGSVDQRIEAVAGGDLQAAAAQRGDPTADRSIIRRASVDVECADVRSTYAKAMTMPSDALGEFIESGSLTGDRDAMRADVTIRVQASRLSLVMNQLRGLGKVTSENTSSLDVTDRLTDLDATIRNERKIESELLDLADKRKDAPLKEVLELRDQLSQVRGRIERLEAQKANAGKQVAYSAIVLSLHATPKEEPKPEPAKSGFGDKMGEAWKKGTQGLTDSLAWCVEAGIARLPLWVFLGATGFAAVILARRALRWSGREPMPRLG